MDKETAVQRATNTRLAPIARLLMVALVMTLMAAMIVGCGGTGGSSADSDSNTNGTTSKGASAETTTSEGGQVGEKVEPEEESGPAESEPANWSKITDLVAKGAKLLCVDTKPEFEAEHVTNATNVPIATLNDTSGAWKKDDTVVLTSSAEEVARSAAAHLARRGFTNIYYLEGGYDSWDGSFEGTNAREATVPSRLIYIYTSNEDAPVVAGNMTAKQIIELSEDIADSMDDLESEFSGDIDVEIVDAFDDPGRVTQLVKDYDVETEIITLDTGTVQSVEIVVLPRWILVDRDGRVTHVTLMPANTALPLIYGWCDEQAASAE